MDKRYDQVLVGDPIPELTLPPVKQAMLVLFAEASGDTNSAHIDAEAARKAGMPDVFAHGMLGMAWLGRLVTNWAPQAQLRKYEVRFGGITHLGDVISCSGKVVEKFEDGGERRVRLELMSRDQLGQTKITGEAIVALP